MLHYVLNIAFQLTLMCRINPLQHLLKIYLRTRMIRFQTSSKSLQHKTFDVEIVAIEVDLHLRQKLKEPRRCSGIEYNTYDQLPIQGGEVGSNIGQCTIDDSLIITHSNKTWAGKALSAVIYNRMCQNMISKINSYIKSLVS